MKRFCLLFALILSTLSTWAQISVQVAQQPVAGKAQLVDITFSFTIAPGWHVYGPDNNGGPTPMTFTAEHLTGAKMVGGIKTSTAPISMDDPMFGCRVTFFEQAFKATQRLQITGERWEASGYLQYGACNDQSCLPPTSVEFKLNGTAPPQHNQQDTPSASEKEIIGATINASSTGKGNDDLSVNSDTIESSTTIAPTGQAGDSALTLQTDSLNTSDLWHPVINELKAFDNDVETAGRSLWTIFLLGMLGGLIALLTPCVWPIIPMTVSFFLKRARDDRRKGIRDAMLYGLSILIIYVGVGLLVTLIWGPSSLNALSTNAVFNLFLFALLVVFAASFLGGFELTLPSSWSTRVDEKATATTGLLSIFLMAFTLVLVSFSCTGPIVGLLLVDMVTSGSLIAPTVGMAGFALTLAAPFTLFALFPTWLKSAPKSGNWMNVIKVVLGLVELAFALKFFSVADLAYGWHLLDREAFLCLWIIIFALMGCYLLGWIRLPHDEDEYDDEGNVIARPRIGVTRFFAALVSLAFALYMIPGLWGAPCKAVSAFAPPMWTQDFRLDQNSVEATYTDFEAGMEAARRADKPVMLDFTGFGCVNCRKMEAAVWPDARVRDLMTEKYILVSLYVDDKTPLSAPIEVTEADGTQRCLRTIGDRWSYLQRTKFGAQTQPFYVLLDHNGHPLAPAYSYNEDINSFVHWLEDGLQTFGKKE